MKFGLTQQFTCNYLPEQKEQLIVSMAPSDELSQAYSELMHIGFRRSGEQLYRPQCPSCNRCQSIRVLTSHFVPTKSQKRVLSRNGDWRVRVSEHERDDYYPLYERYIEALHSDGSMYPPSYEQYRNFIRCQWQQPIFIEARKTDGTLLAVAVTDKVKDGLSALYTYYCPDHEKYSLGKYMIMQQMKQAQEMGLQFLYLGFQIDECRKMNYKTAFHPYQRLIDNVWHTFTL
jgi:arginine-tRNA-protein transferase